MQASINFPILLFPFRSYNEIRRKFIISQAALKEHSNHKNSPPDPGSQSLLQEKTINYDPMVWTGIRTLELVNRPHKKPSLQVFVEQTEQIV